MTQKKKICFGKILPSYLYALSIFDHFSGVDYFRVNGNLVTLLNVPKPILGMREQTFSATNFTDLCHGVLRELNRVNDREDKLPRPVPFL